MGGQCCEEEVGEGTEAWIFHFIIMDSFLKTRHILLPPPTPLLMLVGWVKCLSLRIRRQCLSRISLMHINEKKELLKIEKLHLERSSVKKRRRSFLWPPYHCCCLETVF